MLIVRKRILALSRNYFRFCSFYTQKSATMQYQNEFKTRTDATGKLVPVGDTSVIAEVNDKYGLEQIRDPAKILDHLKSVNFQYPINELVYFIRHLLHIQNTHGVRCTHFLAFKEMLMHLKFVLASGSHERFPYIGSLAYCFDRLGVNDKELWMLMEQKVNDDEYYTNFAESVYAAQGFTRLNLVYYGLKREKIQEKIDTLYKKIERIIRLTIWEVNIEHYHSIATALAQVNRFDPLTFGKLEQHILTNLSLTYETKTMVDILFCFAKGQQGSKDFYDAMQYVIFKGHIFNRNFFLQSKVELAYDGYLVAGLLGVFKQAKARHFDFELHPDFQSYAYNLLANKKTKYTLESAVMTLENLPALELEDSEAIRGELLDKIPKLEGQFTTRDILRFYEYVEQTSQDEKQLPRKAMVHVEENIYKYAEQMLLDDLILLLQYLHQRPKFIMTDPKRFAEKAMSVFDQNLNLTTGAQMQYFAELLSQFMEVTGPSQSLQRRLADIQTLLSYQMKLLK